MPKVTVYYESGSAGCFELPATDRVKAARRKVAEGTHLPFQRRRPDGGLDYILVPNSQRIQRLLRAINFGVFQ